MFKKVKVVMLTANEKAKICLDYTKLTLHQTTLINCTQSWQHLYFLSDEKIEEGDWCYDKVLNIIFQTDKYTDFKYINQTDNVLKIIATTDTSLRLTEIVKEDDSIEFPYITSLPQPSQSFIQKFVEEYNKGNVITEVMVEYEWNKTDKKIREVEIFDDVLKINPKDNTITIRKIKDSWNRAEQTDVIEKYLLMKEPDVYQRTKRSDIKKWIEQNL